MTTLEDICLLITDGKHGDCKNEADSGFYFVSCKDVKDGWIDYSGARQITEADYLETHRRTQLEPNDIVITNSGTIGRMALVSNVSETNRTTFQKSVAIVKPDTKKVIPQWLYYSLIANRNVLIGWAGGTAQKNLLLRDMRAFKVYVPSFSVQHKIAAILSAYDDLIKNNLRRIKVLEEIAQSLYREWFVNFRFPGHEKIRMVDSLMGKIPEGWKILRLDSFGEIITGKTPSKKRPEYYGDYMPFIKLPDMHGNMFCISTQDNLSKAGAESQRVKTLPPNSLCVSCIGTGGVVTITSDHSQTNQQINSIITSTINREFLFFALRGLKGTILNQGATGATMTNLSRGKFANLQVVYPPSTILLRYNEITSPIFNQCLNMQKQNMNLIATRDLIIPKLISGELDVSELDINIPEEAA